MIIVQIEGNIAAGKTRLLEYARKNLCENKSLNIKFIDEPISDWTADCFNLLQLYYKNQKEYSELFQINAFLTLLKSNLKQEYNDTDIVFIERSIYSSFYCFNKLLLDYKYVSQLFYSVLEKALNNFKDQIIYPDIIIYLKTENNEINILSDRIKKRGRIEEQNISLSYLLDLNIIYDNFINSFYLEPTKYIIPVNLTEKEQESKFNMIIETILDSCNKEKQDKAFKPLSNKCDLLQ